MLLEAIYNYIAWNNAISNAYSETMPLEGIYTYIAWNNAASGVGELEKPII